jgi:hypothetical protein
MRDIGLIDFEEDEVTNIYCPMCQKLGFTARMGPKIILAGEKREPDHDKWLQCPECAWLCPIYEAEPEPQIQDSAEIIESAYDHGEVIVMGTENRATQTNRRKRKQANSDRIQRPVSKRRSKKLKLDDDPEINELLRKYGDNVKVIK